MGCSSSREKIEDKMMEIKMVRLEIQLKKEKELKNLELLEGHPIEKRVIPDYISQRATMTKNINSKYELKKVKKQEESEKGPFYSKIKIKLKKRKK